MSYTHLQPTHPRPNTTGRPSFGHRLAQAFHNETIRHENPFQSVFENITYFLNTRPTCTRRLYHALKQDASFGYPPPYYGLPDPEYLNSDTTQHYIEAVLSSLQAFEPRIHSLVLEDAHITHQTLNLTLTLFISKEMTAHDSRPSSFKPIHRTWSTRF